jgi:hypothetical protein
MVKVVQNRENRKVVEKNFWRRTKMKQIEVSRNEICKVRGHVKDDFVIFYRPGSEVCKWCGTRYTWKITKELIELDKPGE